MNMIDEIKRDREAGTPGKWETCRTVIHGRQYGGLWVQRAGNDDDDLLIPQSGTHGARSFGREVVKDQEHDHNDANARRIARVPDMEAALLAADELAAEVEQLTDRLRQYEADGCNCEDSNREYLGHVTPPLARSEYAIATYRKATGAT